MMGDTLDDGLLGFISKSTTVCPYFYHLTNSTTTRLAIGIDLTADYSSHSRNYYNSTSDEEKDDSYIADVNVNI